MRLLILVIICIISNYLLSHAQKSQSSSKDTISAGLINWLTIEEAEEKNAKQPKPIMIDFYTDWCGWCKHMIRTTFSNPSIASYINQYFYPVRFNAETKDSVKFQNKWYYNKGNFPRSTHQLAQALLGDKISYPTLLFFNNNYQFKLIVPGYQDVKKLEPILVYTLENVFLTTSIEDFKNDFDKYYDILFEPNKVDTVTKIKWQNIGKIFSGNTKNTKKAFLFVMSNWCNSCRIMQNVVFNDTSIASIINSFNPVYLNIETNDTINYMGNIFTKPSTQPFHSFAYAISQNKIQLPAIYFFDEENKIITHVNFYINAKNLKPILLYIKDEHYKTLKWEDYIKNYKKEQ